MRRDDRLYDYPSDDGLAALVEKGQAELASDEATARAALAAAGFAPAEVDALVRLCGVSFLIVDKGRVFDGDLADHLRLTPGSDRAVFRLSYAAKNGFLPDVGA